MGKLLEKFTAMRAKAALPEGIRGLVELVTLEIRQAIDGQGKSPVVVSAFADVKGGFVIHTVRLSETVRGKPESRDLFRILSSLRGPKKDKDGKVDPEFCQYRVEYQHAKPGRWTGTKCKTEADVSACVREWLDHDETAQTCALCVERGE